MYITRQNIQVFNIHTNGIMQTIDIYFELIKMVKERFRLNY